MKLHNLFFYGVFTLGLLGHTLATEKDIEPINKTPSYGESFSCFPKGILTLIVDLTRPLGRLHLFQTCTDWNKFGKKYDETHIIPSKTFTGIGKRQYLSQLSKEYSAYGCSPISLCIFSPSETNDCTLLTVINGNTLEVVKKSLEKRCYPTRSFCFSHPQEGIIMRNNLSATYNLVKVDDSPPSISEDFLSLNEHFADMPAGHFLALAFNGSATTALYHSTAGLHNWEDGIFSFQDRQKKYAPIEWKRTGYENLIPFGAKFLAVHSRVIQVVNPNLDGLIEKTLPFPETFYVTHIAADNGKAFVSCKTYIGHTVASSPTFYFTLDITAEKPTFCPLVPPPLTNDYKPVGLHIKNNHFFVAGAPRHHSEDSLGTDVFKKKDNGIFVIFDLEEQKVCYRKFLDDAPLNMYFAGNSLFILADTPNPSAPHQPRIMRNVIAFNIKNWS